MSTENEDSVPRPSPKADDTMGAAKAERFRHDRGQGKGPVRMEEELRSELMTIKIGMELEFEALTTEEIEWQLKRLFETLRTAGYEVTNDTCIYTANGKRFSFVGPSQVLASEGR